MQSHHKKIPIKGKRHTFQLIIVGMLALGIVFVSAFFIWAATIKIPDFSLLETRKVSESTKIYDRTGKILLYDVHKDVRRSVVSSEAISTYIKNATIAIEDDQFYQHHGIKPTAILRAIWVNLKTGQYSQGGSTITQQVIKNSLLSSEKTVTRKLKEWILALKLERVMTKDEILTLYLNEAPYGGSIYGSEEASMSFFAVHAKDVSLAQAAYLAALPQAPTLYSPYGSHKDQLEVRKTAVLKKMLVLGSISTDEYTKALHEEVKFLPQIAGGIRAPHFVMFIKEQLAEQYGEDMLDNGGLNVITTIDMDMQAQAEAIVKKNVAINEKAFNASNAALVVIDPKTGQILTMVGSRDYFDVKHDGNFNIALAKRQPGSSFKPFVYGAGFEKGYTPDTTLFDVPTNFSTRCDVDGNPIGNATKENCYMPVNYDGNFRGPMSVRNALAQSVNVPAVKMLYLVGLDSAIDFAERLGITTLVDKARYGLTLVLGGGEVSLLDMTSAYSVFANDGKRNPYEGLLKVEDKDGTTLYEYTQHDTSVIAPQIARQISDILSDNVARTPEFGADSALNFNDHHVAVKTGTTNNYRDAWIIGYTPSLAVGAWAGNNDNTPMQKKIAGFIVAPMWKEFLTEVFKKVPDEPFPQPEPVSPTLKPALRGVWYGGEAYNVDKLSGKLATAFTPQENIEQRVIPNPHEILFWVDKNNPTGPAPTNPGNDPQFTLWEIPALRWIGEHGIPVSAFSAIPTSADDIHNPSLAPIITLPTFSTSTIYDKNQKLLLTPQVTSNFPITHIDLFVNGVFMSSLTNSPYEFSFIPNDIQNISETNELRITATDNVGNKSEVTTQLLVTPI